MNKSHPLSLHEEILLMSLRDKEGTLSLGFVAQLLGGAVVAELILSQRIAVEASKKQLVSVIKPGPTGDSILDECLEKIAAARRRASLQSWVGRMGNLKQLVHRVADSLCQRRILRADAKTVLLFFTKRIYPEVDSAPEKKLIERVRSAIFSDTQTVDPRTVVLISIANATNLLDVVFGRKAIKPRRKRIAQIVAGEITGKATRDVIAAIQVAIMVATMVPVIASG